MKSINKKKIIITVSVISVIIVLIKVIPLINFVYINEAAITKITVHDGAVAKPKIEVDNVTEFVDKLDTADWRIIYYWKYKWAESFYVEFEPLGSVIAVYGADTERGKKVGYINYNGIYYTIPIEAYEYMKSFIKD